MAFQNWHLTASGARLLTLFYEEIRSKIEPSWDKVSSSMKIRFKALQEIANHNAVSGTKYVCSVNQNVEI